MPTTLYGLDITDTEVSDPTAAVSNRFASTSTMYT